MTRLERLGFLLLWAAALGFAVGTTVMTFLRKE